MNADLRLSIENLISGFRNFGYLVTMQPIEGEEELFRRTLKEGLLKIENRIAFYSEHYRTRGTSKRALQFLHADMPEPIWGVHLERAR